MATPPPPVPARKPQRSGEPFFQQKRLAVPRISVQGPNTLSFWLMCSWSNVQTQSIPQFAKKNFIFRSVHGFFISDMSEFATRPVVYALVDRLTSVGSNPTKRNLLHFLSLGSDLHPKLSLVFMQKQG